jgi:biotin operon repressor
MNRQSPIARAVAELLTERDNLRARLEKVDAAIAAVRDAFHLPSEPRVKRASASASPRTTREAAEPSGNGHAGELSVDAIRAALREGPLSPGALAKALNVSRHRLRIHVAQLEEKGIVASTGKTAGRLVGLPSHKGAAAKEVP